MKKSIFKKLGGLFLGLAMGLGVAVGVTAGNKASEVKAASPVTLTTSLFGMSGTGYVSKTKDVDGTTFNVDNCNVNNGGINMKASTGAIYNSTAMPGTITSVALNGIKFSSKSSAGFYVYGGDSSKSTTKEYVNNTGSTDPVTIDFSNESYKYFYIKNKTSRTCAFSSIVISYSSGFNVTYQPNLPTGKTESDLSNWPSSVTGQSSYSIPSTKPSLPGYKFDGYATSQSAAASKQPGDSITATTTLWGKWTAKTSVALSVDDLDLDLQNDAGGVSPLNPSHSGVTYVVDDESVATYSGGKFYPQAVGETLVTMSKDEDDNNVYIDKIFTITVTSSVSSYAVTWTNTNASVTGSDAIYEGEPETYTITAASGYKLPDTVSVSGATSSYSKTAFNAATLTISEATGPVSFSVAGIALANYGVTFTNEDNFIYDGPENIQEFGEATFELLADDHYDLPETVSVNGVAEKDVAYEKASGQLTISNPTGDVSITVNPVPREHYEINVLGAGDYKSHFSYSGHAAGIYATESAEVTLTPDTSSDDIYVINASNIAVTGVNDWSYSNGVVSLSNPTGDVTITVTPVLKVLESIRVETNPNKTSGYKNGDTLDTTGLVVKAVFNTGEETIPTANLTFSQTKLAVTGTAGTAKSETIYVYYHGKSASFDVSVAPVATGASSYNKITSTSDLTDGKYLIVYETGNVALNGALTSDIASNTVSVSISNNSIASSTTIDAAAVTIDATNKTIKGAYYIGFSGSSNGIKFNQNTPYEHDSITFSNGNVEFKIGSYVMKYNKNSGQERFRYYSSGQSAIQLYKFKEGATKAGVAINAAYTAGSYTAGKTIDLSKLSTTLVYNDGTSSSVSSATISPSTYVEGTAEYTVTYLTYSTVIQIADVAPAKTMTGIRVDDTNVTKAFVVGGTFDSNGLVVYKVFDNGTEEVLESGYTVSTPDLSTAGTKTVTVTYPGFAAQTYSIEVSDSPIMNIVEGAAISGYEGESYNLEIDLLNYSGSTSWSFDPASSEYYEIDVTSEDHSGLVASVTLKKATIEELTVEISEEESGADPVEITIDVDADYLTGIEVTSSKLAYTDGEHFDYDSVTVTASYASSAHENEEIDIDDCTVTAVNSREQAFDLDNPLVIETYTITVEYEGKSESFNISVSMPEGLKVVIAHETPGASTYKLIKDTDSLEAGRKYIIVGIKDSAYYAMKAYASGNNCGAQAIGDTPDADGVIYNATDGLCEFTLGGSAGNWTLFDGSKYLYAAGGTSDKNNHMKGAENADNANAQWSISIATDGKATVVTADSTVVKDTMRYNTGSTLFSCYSSGQSDIYFYEVSHGKSTFTYEEVNVTSTLYAFIRDTYTCEGGGLSSLSGWDDAFNTELNPSYALLTDDDKTILQKGVVSGEVEGVTKTSWDKFAGFITSYDRAVASGCTNYLERAKTNPSRINPLLALNNVDNSVWVISAVALVGLTAIGGYFFYRKRKEI